MKTTITHQLQLEEKAIDAMIDFGRRIISRQELDEAITLALRFYGDIEGHRKIALKGWIIKTIYALNHRQLAELDRIACQYETAMMQTTSYRSGNWEIVKEHIAPRPATVGHISTPSPSSMYAPANGFTTLMAITSPKNLVRRRQSHNRHIKKVTK